MFQTSTNKICQDKNPVISLPVLFRPNFQSDELRREKISSDYYQSLYFSNEKIKKSFHSFRYAIYILELKN